MGRFSTVVVGGGASGMAAAISAKRKGDSVALCEKMPRLGKKILVTGSGRCNLFNETLNESFYNAPSHTLVKSVFSQFGKEDIRRFFKDLGLFTHSENSGRVYPATNQSASVADVLVIELRRLGVPVELNFAVADVAALDKGFVVISKEGRKIKADKVIFAAGGKTYPALGADGSLYELARRFNHIIIEPVPGAVSLSVKDRFCHILQGQRIQAALKSVIDNKVTSETADEILFTKYGLSGIAVLNISREISIAINRKNIKNVQVDVDFVPFMDKETLKKELAVRIKNGLFSGDFVAGILPHKFGIAFKDLIHSRDLDGLADALKSRRFMITGTRGWNEAQFTAGGVDIHGIDWRTLESKSRKGLYFAGEMLDVDGRCGGYNLAWAWASGFVAGLTQ